MFITHNHAHIFSLSFGAGPRTILGIGGWTGSWELWAEPFALLSSTWRTIAYDHRGSGATVAPVDSITVANMVDDLFAVMDAYDVAQCVLAAESAGAVVALQAALARPERISGLVLVDGLAYRPPAPDGQDPFLHGLRTNYAATVERFVDLCVPEPDSDHLRRWGRQILARADQAAAIALYQAVDEVDLRSRLHTVQQPALILHGAADMILPVASSQWLASVLPHSELHIFPDAGHVPTVTRPAAVAAHIATYFAGR